MFFSALLSLILFASAGSEEPLSVPADSVIVLPEITVTDTRPSHELRRVPSRVTRIDAEDIAATASESVADVLAARSNGFIRIYGSTGLATLSLRGASPTQTLLLVDGHRLSDPQTGQVDLALLPVVMLEEIEIIHGAASGLYGSESMAGAVNLRTVPPAKEETYSAIADMGAFGQRRAALKLNGGAGPLSASFATELSRSDGDFSLPERYGASSSRRREADYRRFSAFGSMVYRAQRHRFNLSGWTADAERGLPGPATTPPVGERQWDRRYHARLSDVFSAAAGDWRLSTGIDHTRLRYENPQLELDQTGTSTSYFLDGAFTRTRTSNSWTLGAVADIGTARHPSRRVATIAHGGAFASAAWKSHALLLFPSLRIDSYAAPDARPLVAASPRLGLTAPLPVPFSLRLKGSVGRAFRAPTMNERYWRPGGNPDLRPEHGWAADAGVAFDGRRGRAELTAFWSRVEDEILWLRTSQGYYAPRNVRRVHTRGVELSAQLRGRLASRTHIVGGWVATLTDARDRSDPHAASYDRQLRYVPREQLKIFATVYAGKLALDLNTRYVGRRNVTVDGSTQVDPYLVVDGQLRLNAEVAGASVQMALVAENLLDAQYEVLRLYPMPPRHLRVRLRIDSPY